MHPKFDAVGNKRAVSLIIPSAYLELQSPTNDLYTAVLPIGDAILFAEAILKAVRKACTSKGA